MITESLYDGGKATKKITYMYIHKLVMCVYMCTYIYTYQKQYIMCVLSYKPFF